MTRNTTTSVCLGAKVVFLRPNDILSSLGYLDLTRESTFDRSVNGGCPLDDPLLIDDDDLLVWPQTAMGSQNHRDHNQATLHRNCNF